MAGRAWHIFLGASLLMTGAGCRESQDSEAVTAASTTPAPLCVVTPAEFNSWKNASAGGLGFVAPNSVTFQPTDNCAFYKWASQMFLWLTSEDASGTMNMFSPTFYNAVGSTTSGAFELVRNTEKLGNSTGSRIAFRARVNKPKLLNIQAPNSGSKDSTGQAGGGVLLVDGAPVPLQGKTGYATYPVAYYAIQVNDVFAGLQAHQSSIPYYNSGDGAGDFPTTLAQAQQIQTAAGTTYPDLNQLALEVKSAWVDTAYLTAEQTSGLITISADVPAFTQSTDQNGKLQLTWDGETTVTRRLAMVGIHVTGTVAGHPEMVWATFESVFNTPDNTYSYINGNFDPQTKACTGSCITTVDFSTSSKTPSIFYNGQPGASTPPDSIAETAESGNFNTTIISKTGALVPTNVVRMNPWGSQQPATPTVTDKVVINNTTLLSLRSSLQPQLTAAAGRGRIFANYFQVGSLWANGIIPPIAGSTQFGSLFLANTTMETFQQVSPQNHDPDATAANCFSCHGDFTNGGVTAPGTSISHVFPNVTTMTTNRPATARK